MTNFIILAMTVFTFAFIVGCLQVNVVFEEVTQHSITN